MSTGPYMYRRGGWGGGGVVRVFLYPKSTVGIVKIILIFGSSISLIPELKFSELGSPTGHIMWPDKVFECHQLYGFSKMDWLSGKPMMISTPITWLF